MPLSAHAAGEPELHVLIDVSGSMKKTDPENLREPALRLLGDLVPEESRVRLDLFGNRITSVLPASEATPETKRAMRQAAAHVRSDEPFTDIPAALDAANGDWGEKTTRNVILLSDGKVDISPDEAVNDRATTRLQEEVIPALIDADVQVHTVALSEAADQAILTEIAERTGGLALSARSNEDLQRVFLALFEATAPRTGVPLVENRFRVDDSISELTLVVFRADDADPTRIQIPDGGEIDFETAGALADWRWDDSAGRDLITVRNPPAGSWRILAAEDPDNRALVITDLKLAMPGLPSRVFPGEAVDGSLVLTNRGEPIVEPRLTNDIEAQVTAHDPQDAVIETLELNDIGADPDVMGGDSRYDFRLRLDGDTGIYTLEGRASGPTFERVIRKKIALARLLPFEARVVRPHLAARDGDAAEATHEPAAQLIIEQDVALLDPRASRLVARIECATGEPTGIEAPLDGASNRVELPSTEASDCRVVGEITGTTEDGREVSLPLDESIPAPVSPASEPANAPAEEASDNEAPRNDSDDNPLMAALLGLGGLALLALLGFTWRALARRRRGQLIEAARN
ncbi:VWA domain-containing protein [Guyparkeria sp. SB14A]|uniref:VWA domain-containing protein n=1 Tax=Guyparkeria sp. SB14A TaxID=2571147 RepID=UPI0010AC4C4E|nr:VWA domain-containing protein [Guyparkeria sp. SB14A]TKA91243.1 VWA domain-containing protein [Guyparkeria sp. SB14A]